MRRLQIYIDADLDELLAAEAASRQTSKAAIIRRLVRERLGGSGAGGDEPLGQLIGAYNADPGDVDGVVYGR
ncbi:MAG: ribbon-helix-helix domain-containing protein [Candidatus Dormibacteria bacterium]